MHRKSRVASFLFAAQLSLIALSAPNASFAQSFRVLTEEFPPYNYTHDQKITGISTEIVREIFKRLRHPDNIEVSSWTRAYNLAQKEDSVIVYSTTRTPARERLFKWVGPLVPNNTVFFAKKGSGVSIKSLDDARKVGRIGVYIDDFGEMLLKEKSFTNLHSVPDNRENVRKLADGKIDLWIINELTGNHMAREAGLKDKIEKVYDVQKEFMYMALSKTTPDAVVAKWQRTLDEIKADGTYAQIFSKWIMFSFSKDIKPTEQVDLTAKQRQWLDAHPVIKVATDPDYAPFQFRDGQGVSTGIADDYLSLMSEKLGVTFKPLIAESWSKSLEMVKRREADMVAVASETSERKEYMLFTGPYVEFPDVIVVRASSPAVLSLQQLKGKTVGAISGFAINSLIKNQYPDIKLVEKPDNVSLLKSVSTGEVDAVVSNLATTSHTIEKANITNLRIDAQTGFIYKLAFASRSDWPILNQILEKALASVTPEEEKEIKRKWISLSYKKRKTEKPALLRLTRKEQDWLARRQVITIAPSPSWPPVEYFDEDGAYAGMTADYMSLLEEKLGIRFKAARMSDWEGVLSAARQRIVDIIVAVAPTPDREKYLLFTKPYLHFPSVIVTRNDVKGTLAMENLKGKKVSVVSGLSSHDYMSENYPEIILDPVFNTLEGLRKVAFGKSYAFVGNIATAAYMIENEVIPNLRIAGESGYTFNLALASRSDWPILNSILDKGLSAITEQERKVIYRKWISVAEKPWITIKQLLIGLSVVLGASFIVGIIFWNRQLSHQVELRTVELRASEEKFRNLYKTAMVGLYRTSPDGTKTLAANPALARLLGYDSVESLLNNFVSKDIYVEPGKREQLIARLRKDGMVENFEFLARRVDGTEISVILNATLYKDAGYLEGAIVDITERKQAEREVIKEKERAERATRLKDKFVSLVSHDLRGPIGNIKVMLELVASPKEFNIGEKEKNRLTKEVIEVADGLLAMIEELLDIGRLQSGKIELSKSFFNAYELVSRHLINFSALYEQKGIALTNQLPKNIRLYGDEMLLGEVVKNLVSNSVKFCSRGDWIKLYSMGQGNSAIVVEDSGRGIDEKISADLFKHEVKTTTVGTAGETGTGLGLPYCNDIVLAHGGALEVKSVKGEGSAFFIRLPTVKPAVLLVDDDRMFREAFKRIFLELDMEIIEAEDGKSALRILDESRKGRLVLHLIVTDIIMRDMDGLEFLRRIKEDIITASIPVIVATSHKDMEVRQKVFMAGGDDFVTKPLDKKDMIPRVRRFIS